MSITFVSGNLIVSGSNSSNILTVQEGQGGNYSVAAGTGTTVNGKSAINVGVITPTNVIIRDGNGGDHIAVIGVHPTNGVSVNISGSGDNFVNLSGVIASYVAVNEQGSNNTLDTTSVFAPVGASMVAEGANNIWNDSGLTGGQFVIQNGWSEINS